MVGMRNGQLMFDLPTAELTPVLLDALYASEGGVALQRAPQPVAAEAAFQRPGCA